MPLPTPATPRTQARVLAGAAVGLTGGFTTTYFATSGQFIQPISAEFGWGRSELSLAIVLAMLGSAIASPPAGRLVQRLGPRPVALASGVFLAAGLAALAASPANAGYVALVAFTVGLLSVGTTAAALLVAVPRFFDRRLGLALGGLMAGSAVGVAILQISIGAVLAASGWRATYLVLAGVALVLTAAGAAIGFPAGSGARITGRAETGDGLTVREAVRWPRFVLLLGAVFLSGIGTLGFAVHFVPFVVDQGITPQAAAGASAAAGFGVALGRLVSGALLDRMSAVRVTAAVFVIAALGFAVPAALPPSPLLVYAGASLAGGFALGAEGDILPFLVRRYAGVRDYAPVLGIALGAYILGGVVGPVMFAASFDALGSYAPALWTAAAGMVVAAIGLQFMGPYRFSAATRTVATAAAVPGSAAAVPTT